MHLIHRCQRGFTTVTLMGVLMIGGLLVAGAFAAVDPDIQLTTKDEDGKQAYAAAEAGLNYYLNKIGQDNSYYLKCAQDVPINLSWNGADAFGSDPLKSDPRTWQKVPGYDAEYTIELLPAPGKNVCAPASGETIAQTIIDPKTGTFRIRATGRARAPKAGESDKAPTRRSIVATLRRKAFIDFLWFTDFETADPNTYPESGTFNTVWASTNCDDYRGFRSSSCADQDFISVDTFDGPFKTNDSISVCGTPRFGADADDTIELNGESPGWVPGCGGASPNFQGTVKHPAGVLPMPQSNAELAAIAEGDGYLFDGETTIVLNGSTMNITTSAGTQTKSLPPNGVVYARNTACNVPYKRKMEYTAAPGCGNVRVSGTYDADLTIGADNDIIVTEDFKAGSAAVLGGLIANNFVRVYHPVTSWSNGDTDCNNNGGPGTIQIDAAILALNHSFVVDNYYCGSPLGTLVVNGAIAQKYRGTVGNHSGGSVVHGYAKDYNYNDQLRYREPPYFVNPTDAPWRVVRQNEQIPAR